MVVLRRVISFASVLLAGVLCASCVCIVRAAPAVQDGPAVENQTPDDGCFFWVTNTTYAVGDSWPVKPPYDCAMVRCMGPNAFSAIPCSTALPSSDDCREVPGDENALYPACCPRYECPGDNNVPSTNTNSHEAASTPSTVPAPNYNAPDQSSNTLNEMPDVRSMLYPSSANAPKSASVNTLADSPNGAAVEAAYVLPASIPSVAVSARDGVAYVRNNAFSESKRRYKNKIREIVRVYKIDGSNFPAFVTIDRIVDPTQSRPNNFLDSSEDLFRSTKEYPVFVF